MSVPENPRQTKNPITLKIKFKSSSLEQFIERYSVDVSKSGIFIRTKEPLAVGTQLRFEFQLQDGNALLSGEGTVVWNRAFDPARSSVAPGMGVRFDKLSADSQKVLDRILSEKARRPDSNLESRFDAGVRALREGAAAEANLTSQATPKGDNSSFGDEPTRAMPADQVTKLAAAAMQEDEMPTKHGVPPDLTDEVRRAVGAAADSVKQMTPMTPMTAAPAAGGPNANLGRTLLGQGFMAPPRAAGTAGSKDGPSAPGGPRDAPSVEIRRDPSQQLPASALAGAVADSAKTPTASADEQRARIADSNRTPSGPSKTSEPAAKPPEPMVKPEPVKAPEPMVKAPEPMVKAPEPVKPPEPVGRTSEPLGRISEPLAKPPERPSTPPVSEGPMVVSPVAPGPLETGPTHSTRRSSSSMGLIVGVVVLIGILGALGYVFVSGRSGRKPTIGSGTGAGDSTGPGTATDPATGASAGKPAGMPEPNKPLEPSNVPIKPTESGEGIEITTDPPGVRVEFAGKQYGPTPTRVPGLAVGSQILLSQRGYQEAMIRLRNQPEEGKPLFFKLTAIERVIEVNSTPKGSDVLLDGKRVGKTPMLLKKLDTAKVHQIEVRRAGYAPWTHNVSDTESFVVKNRREVLTLNAVLQPGEEGNKKGPHPVKREGVGSPAAPGAAPTEAAKPPEATPAPAAAPEPAKDTPPAQ
ncbi:MAG TPA: TIGR02266 family protein [Pseudomonadota bacterium]|nr:TIGR02266 family protein [Pseudomonadota bacterium]